MKKILITGGAGFIGSNLSLSLIKKGYEVTVLDCLSAQIHGENPEIESPLYLSLKNKVNFINGSVTSYTDWGKALKDQDIVVHLAAETGTGQSMYEIKRYIDVNIGGTAALLDFLTNNQHTIKKIVVASSRSIYGEGKYEHPELGVVYPSSRSEQDMLNGDFSVKYKGENVKLLATDEDSLLHPSSVYGITKKFQEELVMTVCPTIGIAPVAFRYQNVFGPGQSLSNPYTGILSIFSTQILNGNGIKVFEDGKESRDFVFIDDVVNATILGIEKEKANGHIFNVGAGMPTDVYTVAETLRQLYKKDVSIEITGNFRLGDIRHNYADLKKIETLLGYKPSVTFVEGIKKFVEWVSKQTVQKDTLNESLAEMKKKGLFK